MNDLAALREHLIANLSEGTLQGTVTVPIATFVTEIAEVVGEYLDAAAVRPAGLREAAQWLVDIHGRSVEHGSALWEDIERLRAAAADDAVQKRPSRAASGSLTTEAGRALSELIEAEAVYDPDPLVVAIEQEAAAAERARIERLVEGLPTMREKDMRGEGEDAVWVRFDVVEKSLVIAALRGEP